MEMTPAPSPTPAREAGAEAPVATRTIKAETLKVCRDWTDPALIVCAFLLIVLCAGTPDLLDAIIAWVGRQ